MFKGKKIFSISLIKNEMDIIESFVRYNVNIFDGMLIQDSSSTDDTLKILDLLKEEGLPIHILKDVDPESDDVSKFSNLALIARDECKADMIVPMEADEFLTTSGKGNPRKILDKLESLSYYVFKSKTYVPDFENKDEKFIPAKITMIRDESLEKINKVIIPHKLVKDYIKIARDDNGVLFDPQSELKHEFLSDLQMAHFPIRYREQAIYKIFINWINTLNSGKQGGRHDLQRRKIFNSLNENNEVKDEDLIAYAREYSLMNYQTDIEVMLKEDPMDLSFCENIELKYTSKNVNPLSNLLGTCEEITVNYANQEKEKVRELNLQINYLLMSLYESEYFRNKDRPLNQRIVSKFPILYSLLNINKVGVKNTLINIKAYNVIKKNKLVDIGFYLKKNTDIRLSGMDPILHYIYYGYKEKRNPSPTFDCDYYLKTYEDVEKSNLNPLVHYSLYGLNEGRKTHDENSRELMGNMSNLDFISGFSQGELIKGGINIIGKGKPIITGWITKSKDSSPREAILKIDNSSFEINYESVRSDLQKNRSKDHTFQFYIPGRYCDGKLHQIKLFDKITDKLIVTGVRRLPLRHTYKDFSGFLANSLVSPTIYAPFYEKDKRCFAVMENVAKYLTNLVDKLKEKPLVSVVMPVYNRIDIVKSAVDSVLEQTYQNLELIIVDDCSDDGTRELLAGIDDDRIILLSNKNRQGVSYARNRALKEASGKYIMYLDSDNTWDSLYVAAMVGSFKELPDADAVYGGQFLFSSNQEKPFAVRFGSFNKSLLINTNYIDLNAFCHTRDIYKRLGGFDENLRRYVDWDLIIRVADEAKIYSVPVLLSYYYYDKASNTITGGDGFIDDLNRVREKPNERAPNRNYNSKSPDHGVSIIIPSYESLKDIQECIDSISALTADEWLEIIVVDNASSRPVVDYLDTLKTEGRIKLIKNGINYGFTYAVNQGISVARPDNDIIIMNNDAIIMKGAIENMQKAAHELPQCGLIVPQQVLPGGTKTINTHVPYANSRYDCDVNLSIVHDNIINMPLFHSGEFTELNFAPFFCVYIKRDVLNQSLGLDAEFGRHYRSDRIFCNYIRHVMNLKIYHVADAVVYHKLQKSTEVLRELKQNSDFEKIFRKNQWDAELSEHLGYKTPVWDL